MSCGTVWRTSTGPAAGDEPDWPRARRRALDELHVLIAAEDCCQEYRLLVNSVPAIVFPGINEDGSLDVSGVDSVLDFDRYGRQRRDVDHPFC